MRPVTATSLLRLAVPAAASVILNNAFRVIDQYSVQWLGTASQAAIGSMAFVMITAYASYALIAGGVGPLVARATGAGDGALRRRVVGNGLVGASAVGALVLGSFALWAPQIAGAVGLHGGAAIQAERYLRWLAVAGWPIAVAPVVDAALLAMGHMGAAMALNLLATVLNGVLNWLLIYRLGMGIGGAALASGLSRGVAVVLGLWLLRRAVGLEWRDLWPGRTLLRVARIGWPLALDVAAFGGVYWGILRVAISPLGPAVNAALGIGFSALEGFTWPMFHGLSLAVASLVGRHLGAGQPQEAARAVRLGLPLASVAGALVTLIFWFGAESLCGLFTQDAEVLAYAVGYARVLAFSQLFIAWESLASGALSGAGATRTVLAWSAPLNLLRVPLSWLLAIALGWGAAGVWWAINITTIAKAAGKGWSAWRGGWRETVV